MVERTNLILVALLICTAGFLANWSAASFQFRQNQLQNDPKQISELDLRKLLKEIVKENEESKQLEKPARPGKQKGDEDQESTGKPWKEENLGCILYFMTDGGWYFNEIRSSILLLEAFFNNPDIPSLNERPEYGIVSQKPYDILIFTTNLVTEEHKKAIRALTKTEITFVEWKKDFPKWLQDRLDVDGITHEKWSTSGEGFATAEKWLGEHKLRGDTCVDNQWGMGYLLMNRFFSYQMYTHPELNKYKYYMRIDTDSYISGVWNHDPFLEMENQQATFLWKDIYGDWPVDPESCIRDMKKEAVKFYTDLRDNQKVPEGEFWTDETRKIVDPPAYPTKDGITRLNNLPNGYKWEGNLGVGRLSFFRSNNFLSFAKYLNDETEGIFKHRWGDQAVYPLAVTAYEHRIVKGWGHQLLPLQHKQRPKPENCPEAQRDACAAAFDRINADGRKQQE